MASDNQQRNPDRKITLGLVLTVLVNVGTSVWWASALNSQVMSQQRLLDSQTSQIAAINAVQSGVGERLAKMEAGILYQTKSLDRIEEKLGKK